MTELRRTPRARLDADVDVAIAGEHHAGRSRDISNGGMFLEASVVPEFGAEVIVTLTMPGQKAPFAIPGVVRWTRDGGMGVQFGLLGARETHAITEFVARSSIRLNRP
ncbi:MAG: PilZ domain-containing protein [Polyangiaceae bacterium]